MTLPDPIHRPRGVLWEHPGGSSLRRYSPAVDATGGLSVNLELLDLHYPDDFVI